jgi:hypothetical protein
MIGASDVGGAFEERRFPAVEVLSVVVVVVVVVAIVSIILTIS